MAPRDYARLHWDWHEDPVIDAIADDPSCPGLVLTLWPVLVAMSKKASHDDNNPAGVVDVTWSKLAAKARRPLTEVAACMDLLVDGELVDVEDGRVGMKRVALIRFGEWQVPRQSKAEHEQKRRDRRSSSRDFVVERGVGVGAALGSSTQTETEEEPKELTLSATDEPVAVPAKGPSPEQVRKVFEEWRRLFQRNANTALDDKRRKRIRWALQTYGPQVVWDCLRGYAADPWRHEQSSRNEIATLLKDAAHVDDGVEKWRKERGLAPVGPAASGIDMGYER